VASEAAEYQRKVTERAQRRGRKKGRQPKPPSQTPAPDDQINLTDTEAKLMRKSKSEGYTQSYNAQAVVDAGGSYLIVGQRVCDCPSDAGELVADVASIPASLGQPTKVLADCGFVDREAFKRLEEERPGWNFMSVCAAKTFNGTTL